MKSPFKFAQHGECGKWVSEIFPNLSQHVDKMAFVHSAYCQVEQPQSRVVHGQHRLHTDGLSLCRFVGDVRTRQRKSRPASVRRDVRPQGSRSAERVLVELGSRFFAQRVPGDVAQAERRSDRQFESTASELSDSRQRAQLDLLVALNKDHFEENPAEKELAARIESFELAYRMQSAAPEALDVDSEPRACSKAVWPR